jgi:hypothetical protein
MSEEQYNTVMDTNNDLGLRLQAFANRANWLEPLGLDKGYTFQINHMIHNFDEMGIVEVRKGLPDDPNFPAVMEVENMKEQREIKLLAKTLHLEEKEEEAGDIYDLSLIEKVKRFR